jgi:hypothetical protein
VGEIESQPAAEREVESPLPREAPATKTVPAETLYPAEPAPMPDPEDPDESPYKAVLRAYYARQQAIQAGLIEKPAPRPRDPNKPLPEGIRRYNETMAQIERNKFAAELSWQKLLAQKAAEGRPANDDSTTNP